MAARATRKPPPRVDQRTRAARAEGRAARDELLTAALRVFARRGYGQAGVDEIAAEAGYSKGALYWHFSGKEELLLALIEERIDAPMREMVALLESAPPDRDMSEEATLEFARQLAEQREAMLLEREYWSLAIRDPQLRSRYAERQTELRGALAAALEARARHLGTPDLPMPAEDVARIVMSIIGGLTIDELTEPGSVRPDLLGDTLALVYAGLLARARRRTGYERISVSAMAADVPAPIAAFVRASNDGDREALLALFSDDAVVHDEGREHNGIAAVRAWREEVERKYTFTIAPLQIAQRGDETVLTVTLTGDFPGSPVTVDFDFTLADDRIVGLAVHP
jgi:AcrR family transcriptional regulator